MTAIVLAGGRGRRLQTSDASGLATAAQRRAAARGLKVLMPVGPGRLLVDDVLARLAAAGVTEAVIVVPPDHAELAAHLAAHPMSGLQTRLVVQPVPNGTAGAVAVAAAHISAPACLVVNGDNVYPADALAAVAALDCCGMAGFTRASLQHDSGFPPERVAAFAIVEHDADGWLTGIREKPPVAAIGPATPVSMNLWRMDQAMLAACADVAPSPRGELELPDAVMLAVSRGSRVRVVPAAGVVLDLTTAADVAVVSRALASRGPGA